MYRITSSYDVSDQEQKVQKKKQNNLAGWGVRIFLWESLLNKICKASEKNARLQRWLYDAKFFLTQYWLYELYVDEINMQQDQDGISETKYLHTLYLQWAFKKVWHCN